MDILGQAKQAAGMAVGAVNQRLSDSDYRLFLDSFRRDIDQMVQRPELYDEWVRGVRRSYEAAVDAGDMETAGLIRDYFAAGRYMYERARAGQSYEFLPPELSTRLRDYSQRVWRYNGLPPAPSSPRSGSAQAAPSKSDQDGFSLFGLSERQLDYILPILMLLLMRR